MLRVGIVGCGGIFNGAHFKVYKHYQSTGAQVVALCDIKPEKMDAVENRLGFSVKKYTDYKEMIDTEHLDYVDICTPNYLHADIAIYAMQHHTNAFSEKPDTISVERVLEMQRVQKETGMKLMCMRNNRYWVSSQEIKSKIKSGDFGEIYTGRCGWIRKRGIPGKGGWFTNKAQSGGGPLIDLGVHMIDLAIYLMGNPKAVSVSGCTYSKFANSDEKADSVHAQFGEEDPNGIMDVEDLAIGFIKFDNGASLQIEFSWASNIKKESTFVELRGTKLGVKWDNGVYELYDGHPYSAFKGHLAKAKQVKNQAKQFYGQHCGNILHFIDVINGKAEPDYTIDQGVNMIKILCAMYESAKTGKEVIL